MAAILIAGAIPSGLAAVISSYSGLLVCRFFIGVLGSTFVRFSMLPITRVPFAELFSHVGAVCCMDNCLLQQGGE